MKKILIGGAVVVVIVVAAVVFLGSNLNSLVAAAIERLGGEVTGTEVAVSGVDLSLREGRGSIRGLDVASPEGFDTGDALSLADITVDLDVASLRADPIVLDEVRIEAPVMRAEVSSSGETNLGELLDRIRASTPAPKDGGGAEKRIRITSFVCEKGRIEVDASALGGGARTLDLPAVRLADVGGADGAPAGKVAQAILEALVKQATSEIASSEVEGLIRDQVGKSLSEKAGSVLKTLTD